MLVATTSELAGRRQVIAQSPTLTGLSHRLRRLLQPLLDQPISIPDRKAMLSQDGGVCPDDGSRLEFDPLSPDRHRCPRCGAEHTGERHHLAWLMRYHIWLSERAVHLALLGALDSDPQLTTHANAIVKGYAERYAGYPNRDNVLGPSRLFFSTYLESIWLIQVSIAASLTGVDVREMLAESAAIVQSFDETWSNRQVWNNTAMVAAGRVLGDSSLVEHGLNGRHGLRQQLLSLATDGSWHEGQNYHFFALRGMQLGAELVRPSGSDLYSDAELGGRLGAMSAAPLGSLLPDLTIPARADSPYGVSVRQPRFAELWELARARTGDERLAAVLAELYEGDAPDGPDVGLAELAEQEQNRPASRVSRERLGWKSLLWMLPDAPKRTGRWERGSTLSLEQGLAVLRSPGRYVSLECGGQPGGHGHPDLLHLTLYWDRPWLMDFGTGSYVSPSLHWYRSTLAHNAPAAAGAGQVRREGYCEAFDTREEWVWCRGVAREPFGPRSQAHRTVIVSPDYVLDVVDIKAPVDVEVELPIHPLGTFTLPVGLTPGQLAVTSQDERAKLFITIGPRAEETLYVTAAPGPPDLNFAEGGRAEFLVRRAAGPGRWVQAYATSADAVQSIELRGDDIRVMRGEGDADTVNLGPTDAKVWSGTRSFRLSGRQRTPSKKPPLVATLPLLPAGPVELSGGHYRRSEEPYGAARFVASVEARVAGREVAVTVRVQKPDLVFRRASDPDPRLDNETPDIHSDSVQLYAGLNGWEGYLLVPDPDSTAVRVRPVAGTAADPSRVSGTWTRSSGGYDMEIHLDVGRELKKGEQIPFNLVVNEMRPGRQRRAGQLALSGGAGWVYLRGDRESPATAWGLEVR